MSQALSTIHSISSLLTSSSKATKTHSPCLNVQMSSTVDVDAPPTITLSSHVPRRNLIALGIASAVLGQSINEEKNNAWAAGRRTPAAPKTDEEKKDPNISGVQAKVLASKKRKEAMKQAMQQQRERGKKIIDDSSNNKNEDSSSKAELSETKIEE